MDSKQNLDHEFETIAWGLLFILWGITILVDFLPIGVGLVGTGFILLGLNAARRLKGIPGKSGTTVLGILALVAGALFLLPFELSFWTVCAILLIVFGVLILARVWPQLRNPGLGALDQHIEGVQNHVSGTG